jgi:hypothetical protein
LKNVVEIQADPSTDDDERCGQPITSDVWSGFGEK